ncbi:hypothetical protein CANTEDRAFT_136275 [Yamadazyma tenuis ATCC 10573]|uniref:Telomere-associated protein Rif1 N-terminal domain-containing protein n=2 Tax=Candida tenuis TaxID=2315449 RepID=G3B840_CANTC|nr:uncharacterized protein CANTEDRAFT_136275 [Yamadazyma tenuis ATCC 10573]EGV62343.1 hypothetical protein CANTEDRAFT_136275 [Yamadazyma tenuis ATCC 10573]
MSLAPLEDRPITRSRARLLHDETPKSKSHTKSSQKRSKSKKNRKRGSKTPLVVSNTTEEHQEPVETRIDASEKVNEPTQVDEHQNDKPSLKPVTGDIVAPDMRIVMGDLNSSPIKKTGAPPHDPVLSSSPFKLRKNVMFSDDLTSDVPFLPQDGSQKPVCITATPKKSILKGIEEVESPQVVNESSFTEANFVPEQPTFWTKGNIVQLPVESHRLARLIQGCIAVLKIKSFDKRFEVYASLNHNFKSNTPTFVASLLVSTYKQFSPSKGSPGQAQALAQSPEKNLISVFSAIVQRDITFMEASLSLSDDEKENVSIPNQGKNDPFFTRTISQALKLISFFMTEEDLNEYLSLTDLRWFYSHSATLMMKPKISKTLAVPYLMIVKECKYPLKKRKLLFNNIKGMDIPEQMLFAVINMKNFPSKSLVSERLIAVKNLVQNFPTMMLNNFKHWFEIYLMTLCDVGSPFYSKIIGSGVLTLLEIAKACSRDREVNYMTQQCLSSQITSPFKSFASDFELDSTSFPQKGVRVLDLVIQTIKELMFNKRYKAASDIWVGISLMACDKQTGFDQWDMVHEWTGVVTSELLKLSPAAQVALISSWKVVVYDLCVSDLDNLDRYIKSEDLKLGESIEVSDILKRKFDLLLVLPRILKNVSCDNYDILHASEQVVLAICYTIFNQQGKNTKYLSVYWDNIMVPLFQEVFFKKSKGMQLFNFGERLLQALLDTTANKKEYQFLPFRCLSTEAFEFSDVLSLNSAWVFKEYPRILNLLQVPLYSTDLSPEYKLDVVDKFSHIFPSLVLKSPSSPEAIECRKLAYNIIEQAFSKGNPALFVPKVFDVLKKTFGLVNLTNVDNAGDNSANFLSLLFSKIAESTPDVQDNIVEKMLHRNGRKDYVVILYLIRFGMLGNSKVDFQKSLKTCEVDIGSRVELKLIGALFEVLTSDFTPFAKRVIQAIVLLNARLFEEALSLVTIQRWSPPIFKFFVLLIHDTPFDYMKQMAFNLILLRFEQADEFVSMISFLISSSFDLELYNLRKAIMKRVQSINETNYAKFKTEFHGYLNNLKQNGNMLLLDEFLATCQEYGFEILDIAENEWAQFPRLKEMMESPKPFRTCSPPSDEDSEVMDTFSPESANEAENDSYMEVEKDLVSEEDDLSSVKSFEVDMPQRSVLEIPESPEADPESPSKRHRPLAPGEPESSSKRPKMEIQPYTNGQDIQKDVQLLSKPDTIEQVKYFLPRIDTTIQAKYSSQETNDTTSSTEAESEGSSKNTAELDRIMHVFNNFDQESMRLLTPNDRDQLECRLLQFMLQLKQSKP